MIGDDDWIGIHQTIVGLRPGQAVEFTRHHMRTLVRTGQTWPDSERNMTDEEINREIRAWPMFADYAVTHNVGRRTWRVLLPEKPRRKPLEIPVEL